LQKIRDASRQIWLCADDYGISPAVNAGIRELIAGGRLNATSVMVASPHLDGEEVAALQRLNANGKRAAIGLHVTLTGPFKPMSAGFTPRRDGAFLPLGEMMRMALARRLSVNMLSVEIARQLEAFTEIFGTLPDFVDGHQHVQLFPQIRDAFLKTVAEIAPNAWVRQCGRANSLRRIHDRKALVLDILSMAFRRRAERQGLATNPAFAGAYNFSPKARFPKIFPRFLAGLPDGGLIMCHPGFVDAQLEKLDPLTTLREHEFAYFNSDAFPQVLAEHGVALAQPTGNGQSAA
jgi:predicted glycoside hydrolase/deacetylase ChbG (UPF0249 family)